MTDVSLVLILTRHPTTHQGNAETENLLYTSNGQRHKSRVRKVTTNERRRNLPTIETGLHWLKAIFHTELAVLWVVRPSTRTLVFALPHAKVVVQHSSSQPKQ